MSRSLRFSDTARKSLKKLDKQTARRILTYLKDTAELDDPAQRGKALTGNLTGFWRYRAGDYRIICDLFADVLVIYVIDVDHRSEIYRKL